MTKKFLTLILISLTLDLFSQQDTANKVDRKYVAWISPSNATHVYGFMFNFWDKENNKLPKIYGTEINLNPLGLFAPIFLIYAWGPQSIPDDNIDSVHFKRVYGLQMGLINLDPTIINGLDINIAGSFESWTNGMTISVIMNKHYIINGLTIGILGNHDAKCNGMQIGLFNSCRQLKGFQFGLWNKNQKRSLPFVNFTLK